MGSAPVGEGDKTPLPLTLAVIACWYACNILVVLGNKYLLSHTGFNKPVRSPGAWQVLFHRASGAAQVRRARGRARVVAQVFLTLSHMTACVLLGALASLAMPLKPLKSGQQTVKVGLLAFIFCSTILLGNASLQ